MAGPSSAENFFRSIPDKDEAAAFQFLSALVGSPEAEENGWRDYKGAWALTDRSQVDPEKPSPEEKRAVEEKEKKIKAIWSEYLSAFSNTEGGVLIWGLSAPKKIPTAPDYVQDCTALRNRLVDLINSATEPPVPGVEVHFARDGAHSKGFVYAYVPESSFKPHRALWGERTFFLRNQDSSFPCPTALLRSLFYPSQGARFSVTVSMSFHDRKADELADRYYLLIRVASLGPSTAENLIIVVEARGACRVFNVVASGAWQQFGGSNSVRCVYPLPPNLVLADHIATQAAVDGEASIAILVFSHNMPVQYCEVDLKREHCTPIEGSTMGPERSFRTKPVY